MSRNLGGWSGRRGGLVAAMLATLAIVGSCGPIGQPAPEDRPVRVVREHE